MPLGGMLIAAGVGAGAGLGKHYLSDKPKYESEKRVAAETAKWSPWTGMKSSMPDAPSAFGSALKFGMAGASMGQGMANSAAYNKYLGSLSGGTGADPTAAAAAAAAAEPGGIASIASPPSGSGQIPSSNYFSGWMSEPEENPYGPGIKPGMTSRRF